MSRTVSFRASEELDEFLEQEAEKRMTTKSTVAQMMVAERAQQLRDSEENETNSTTSSQNSGKSIDDVFERHPTRWYEPDSRKYNYVVRTPDSLHDDRRYYKTKGGAEKALRSWWED